MAKPARTPIQQSHTHPRRRHRRPRKDNNQANTTNGDPLRLASQAPTTAKEEATPSMGGGDQRRSLSTKPMVSTVEIDRSRWLNISYPEADEAMV
jgi:hypothetical protein